MRFALLLLWLTTLAPAAHAADWLTWRRVGEATLTWGPFTVYHSQLRTPNGRYDGPQQDRALRSHRCLRIRFLMFRPLSQGLPG